MESRKTRVNKIMKEMKDLEPYRDIMLEYVLKYVYTYDNNLQCSTEKLEQMLCDWLLHADTITYNNFCLTECFNYLDNDTTTSTSTCTIM